jgi:hypothetical protein
MIPLFDPTVDIVMLGVMALSMIGLVWWIGKVL